jgi:hypothetical protein
MLPRTGIRAQKSEVDSLVMNNTRWRAVLVGAIVVVSSGGSRSEEAADLQALSAQVADFGPVRNKAHIFFSGHSLTDQPLPNYLAALAQSLGTPARWNRQYVFGSSIQQRTRGLNANEAQWLGYHQGDNREGRDLNVIDELRHPKTIGGDRYDVLIVTELNHLLGSMIWFDTVGYLRHFHERLIEGNPQATTYFFESWISVNDKNDPARWIAYERAASPVWQCVVQRINTSLAAEGRSDRIRSLPAGLALATLVERAIVSPGLPGLSGSGTSETMDAFFRDDVHLTELATYYVAAVSYATIYRRNPIGGWAPPGVSREQATVLQGVAWDFVTNYLANSQPMSVEACRGYLADSFISTYWTYVRDVVWRKDHNVLWAYAQWVRHLWNWRCRFSRDSADNPLHFDPKADQKRWYPAP